MTYHPEHFMNSDLPVSAAYAEGVLLAVNLACQPIEKSQWQSLLTEEETGEFDALFVGQFQKQYQAMLSGDYHLDSVIDVRTGQLEEWAGGFLSAWSFVEPTWQEVIPDDGTQRLLQAIITLCFLITDREATIEQMKAAGIDDVPDTDWFIGNIDMMIHELVQFADSQLLGQGAQRVNPYKSVGRNDLCPCQSGKKFKNCCGQ
ncbi:SEC-C metal-binding domain-containing protein [Vibrio salinus]|uniref:SEC-C metal-binding domain-containing protein n=1 Tax=Vibrio salinus TaxID=2899784 RepID=UPI001E3B304A|nr:SEC-C metal-binding domain-containing protein [Vibrio salinus]MCE0496200.1 SEC-C domain-containing protein [Vibrio salinus]